MAGSGRSSCLAAFVAVGERWYGPAVPKWGLTEEMRATRPYDLEAELLAPAKIITDPVHGDIRLTELERRVVDSPAFQRLRRVRQLGTTHLVYPGATHTRFSHSLGAVEAAQKLFDVVLEQRGGLNPKREDLFGEWLELDAHRPKDAAPAALRRVAEAIVLTRLGALLHDLCHIPFGHTIEDELGLLVPHDENRIRFDRLWAGIDGSARQAIEHGTSAEGRTLFDDMLPLILSKLDEKGQKPTTEPEDGEEDDDVGAPEISYPFAQDIVGNTISADLLDYLTRDHRFTGLPASMGERFLDGFYVSRSDARKPRRMVLRIVKRQRERRDTISELLKYLRFRYELSERVLTHHAKLAADAMVGKLLGLYSDLLLRNAFEQRARSNAGVKARLTKLARDDVSRMATEVEAELGAQSYARLEEKVRENLEDIMLEHGDDGLLERMRWETRDATSKDPLRLGIQSLASAVLERRLYKSIAHFGDLAHAERLWEAFGKRASARRSVERAVARFAELAEPWRVAVWIPPEKMRLKPALVLVDDDDVLTTLLKRERPPRGEGRGIDIYQSHRGLWALEIFVHADVRAVHPEVVPWLQAMFAEKLEIRAWTDATAPVQVADVAHDELGDQLRLTRGEKELLHELTPSFREGSVAADPDATRGALVDELREAASKAGFGAQNLEESPRGEADEAPPEALDIDVTAGKQEGLDV